MYPVEFTRIIQTFLVSFGKLNGLWGAVMGYLELASIYALPEALDSHYKMLETAEECRVKFNYVYIFTHTHQILLLT